MRKAQLTRENILRQAYEIASREGLEALSFGVLADRLNMSKSGVYAHFGSIELLRASVLRFYRERFEREILEPARLVPDGLHRLHAIFFHCIQHISTHAKGGMFYSCCAAEYDDRGGPVRDELVSCISQFRAALLETLQSAVQLGQLKADSDPCQLVFEIYALLLLLQHDKRLLTLPDAFLRVHLSFSRIIQNQACDANFKANADAFPRFAFWQNQAKSTYRSRTKWEACCAPLLTSSS
ncbi:TetR/AcrR family transcriptional regulator [Noviherbaspirillum denitrificans]|uniref:HTH tetR-type domain-containing protein n=1 Tax=Noviherbaspirillum denitrificans TaxID=1968433 RepID=A0A254TCE3_9BURK|nr:TetR/AcrR family transcriptional regulator [Noviherbaspirillum denitrificans]OWW20304.1 hypothetical protein AYR66_13180 [Noviherbaspirillum denitrificans]